MEAPSGGEAGGWGGKRWDLQQRLGDRKTSLASPVVGKEREKKNP